MTGSGVLLDCGCNVLRRLDQLFGTQQRDEILRRLIAVAITHPHFDHYSYLLSLLCFYRVSHSSAVPCSPILVRFLFWSSCPSRLWTTSRPSWDCRSVRGESSSFLSGRTW